jgi:hypothetical protein
MLKNARYVSGKECMSQERFAPTLVISFLIGMGLWLSYFCWGHIDTSQRLEQSSVVIEGRVMSNATRSIGKRGQSFTLVVEYLPAKHPAITKEFDVDGSTYTSALASSKAKVTYLPEDPKVSLITPFAAMPYQILLGFAILLLIAGLSLLWYETKAVKNRSPH